MSKIKNNICFGSVIFTNFNNITKTKPMLIGFGLDNNLEISPNFYEKTRQFKLTSLPPLDDAFFMHDENTMLKNMLNSQNLSNNYKVNFKNLFLINFL